MTIDGFPVSLFQFIPKLFLLPFCFREATRLPCFLFCSAACLLLLCGKEMELSMLFMFSGSGSLSCECSSTPKEVRTHIAIVLVGSATLG